MDFLQVSSRREAIHAREHGRCFYCLRRFFIRGRVLDHVVPQARGGTNSYRNLVSCCVECNSQRGESGAEDFLRTLYRLRRLTSAELEAGLRDLDALAAGQLRPVLAAPAVVSHVVGAGLAPPGVVIRKPENPRNRKAWPHLPKLARRKKGPHTQAPKSTNPTEGQNPKPAP